MRTRSVETLFWAFLVVFAGLAAFSEDMSPVSSAEPAPTAPPAEEPAASRPAEGLEGLHLTLQECVELALRAQAGVGNFALQIVLLDPRIARTQVTEAEAAFDPVLSLSTLFSDSASLSATGLAGAALQMQESWSFGGTLSKRFKTGAIAELTYSTVRTMTNSTWVTINPSYDTDLGLTIAQPLLRNAGRAVNTAEIRLADNDMERSEYELRNVALSIVRTVTEAYWNLVFAIENLEVRKKSLALSEGLLADNRKRLAVGSIAPLEVAGAEADVERRKQEIIVAEAAIAQARDDLRNLINNPRDTLREDLVILPRDSATLVIEPVNTFDAVREALAWRPDLRQAGVDITSANISVVVAKNQLFPVVDLVATYNRNGLGGQIGNSHEDLFRNGHTRDWQAGINVEIPLGNRAARSAFTRSNLQKTKALLAYENTRRNIIVQVRAAVRNVTTALASVRAAEFLRIFTEKNLTAEERKFEVGKSTSLDVLDAQEQLSQAESAELSAIIQYNIALAALEETKGTLLERVGVKVGPPFSPDLEP